MGKASELFAIVGSSGYLEICTNRGSAAKAVERESRVSEVSVTIGGSGRHSGIQRSEARIWLCSRLSVF